MSEANERYRHLVELSPYGILIVQNGRIVFSNSAVLRLVGAPDAAHLQGRSPFDLFHPESQASARERLAPLLFDQPAATVLSIEEKIAGSDGAPTDVEVTGTVFDDENGPAVQLILRDITQRKRTEAALRESEERLTLAFAGAQEGVWDWNLETGAVVYSARWKEMLGYADDEIEPHVSA